MIEALRLENFKAIGAAQSVPIRPITLIFGANNSGKSSILQSLLLLKQTLEEADSMATTLLPRGSLADLHSLSMLRHRPPRPDPAVAIAVRLNTPLGRLVGRRDPGPGIPEVPRDVLPNAWMSFRFGSHRQDDVLLESCAVGAGAWDEELVRFSNLALDVADEPPGAELRPDRREGRFLRLTEINPGHPAAILAWQRFQSARDAYRDAKGGAWRARGEESSPSYHFAFANEESAARLLELEYPGFIQLVQDSYSRPLRLRHFLPEPVPEFPVEGNRRTAGHHESPLHALDLLDPRAICGHLGRQLGRILQSETEYTGPRRFGMERYYIYSGSRTERVGPAGQRTPDLLFAEPEALRQVNSWLEHFGVGSKLKVHRLEDGKSSSAFFLELVYSPSGLRVQLADVGSGLRQLLPVIVQTVASRRKLLLIEEPESHLHPRMQAQLGDLFAESVRSGQNHHIIETHSEHLVLRIQRLVRQGALPADSVSILFVRRSRDGARVDPLRLDREGDFIDQWPEGFFPERLAELL